MFNLICIRHGESIANVNPELYYTIQDYLIPLTEKGKEQAKSVGYYLNTIYPLMNGTRYLIHSPWLRAKQTALEIANKITVKEIIEDPLIHEISLSHSFSEMETKEFYLKAKDDYGHYWYKDGTSESYADVYQRARIFIQDLKNNRYNFESNSNVLIVSHGLFLIMLKGVLNNLTVKQILEEKWLDNCDYFTSQV